MFDSLKKKFSLFKKRAEEQLPEEEADQGATPDAEPPTTRSSVGGVESREEAAKDRQRRGFFGNSGRRIKQGAIEDLLWDLEVDLMEADVALEVAEEIKSGVESSLVGAKIDRRGDLGQLVTDALRDSVGGCSARMCSISMSSSAPRRSPW